MFKKDSLVVWVFAVLAAISLYFSGPSVYKILVTDDSKANQTAHDIDTIERTINEVAVGDFIITGESSGRCARYISGKFADGILTTAFPATGEQTSFFSKKWLLENVRRWSVAKERDNNPFGPTFSWAAVQFARQKVGDLVCQ